MHMNKGVYFTLPAKKVYLFEDNKNFFNDKTEEFGSMVDELLKNSDIKIHLENTGILDFQFIKDAVLSLLKKESFNLT
jgi:hypothetical protein